MHVHILGICGTLMGSIAILAQASGHQVSGCDDNVYPPMSDLLATSGISLSSPYSAENIPFDVDLFIIGNANLPRGNPAVEHVLNSGVPYTSGAEWLGMHLLEDKWVIAVSGTHGKTTTSAMIAWILEYAGMKPGFLIGGLPNNFSESARIGETSFFVIEADEYDTSYFDRRSKFLHYKPRTLVINNLEYDHADIFPDLKAIKNQFHLLVRSVPGTGTIIRPQFDGNIDSVIDMGCWSEEQTFNLDSETSQVDAAKDSAATLSAFTIKEDGSEFNVFLAGEITGSVSWELNGEHNIKNALSAILAARNVGILPEVACEALGLFKGVKRRMEVIHQNDQITIYDDFAHHPTAIQTTLAGLRQRVQGEGVLAIIELGSHTMRKGTHLGKLSPAVSEANHVIWFKPASTIWDMETELAAEKNSICTTTHDIIELAINIINKENIKHLVIMSNSGFQGIHKSLIEQIKRIEH
ncbi:MAG: UDP-N-acetylmuramate: L-alanyl-gamma-D-glutamyl-meso-diaminopimelate ligase [Candidatus Azotimanducaceae bacterium]|jgi:UDP-N-acetylmuramate: L-alanyl-gamma-D-glutamyl-meso-diaminopimelate ligase